jgi:DNA-binding beta-propeller fold protein YncE
MIRLSTKLVVILVVVSFVHFSCAEETSEDSDALTWESVQDSADMLASVSGFSGPEAVRYDPDQDVYFVANFNGDGGERDANGFISKLSPDGTIDSLQFMTGTEAHPLHAPRGMYITGDTLWACDADGVHGFNRMSGEQVAFIDFTEFEPGFLNDIVEANGNLYVTDTGKSAVYEIADGTPSVFVESLPSAPNGITTNANGDLILAPWGGDRVFHNLSGTGAVTEFTQAQSGGNFDGIEFVNGYLVAASQMDSSLHAIHNGEDHVIVNVTGRPADIGVDTERRQVAVPYIALNRVDIWQLPE